MKKRLYYPVLIPLISTLSAVLFLYFLSSLAGNAENFSIFQPGLVAASAPFLQLLFLFIAGTPLAWLFERQQFALLPLCELFFDALLLIPAPLLIFICAKIMPGLLIATDGVAVVLWTLIFFVVNIPLYVRLARLGFAMIPLRAEQAARCLGAGPGAVFWRVVWPMARGRFHDGLVLCVFRALSDLAVLVIWSAMSTIPGSALRVLPLGLPHVLSLMIVALLVSGILRLSIRWRTT